MPGPPALCQPFYALWVQLERASDAEASDSFFLVDWVLLWSRCDSHKPSHCSVKVRRFKLHESDGN